MKKIILLSIAAAITLASCQKSEEQSPAEQTQTAVTFTSGITTRATNSVWDADDEIGVFMYYVDDTELYNNYGSNALYYISSGAETTSAKFTSDSPLYYPQTQNMDFVAYYPYKDGVASGTAFTVGSTDQSSEEKLKALDLMVARAANCSEGSSPTLSFERKMSKVVFNVDIKDTAKDLAVSDFTLSNVVSGGTCTIVNTSSSSYNKVTADATTSEISLFINDSDEVEAIIVPQDETDAKIAFSVDGDTYYGTFTETFEAGMQYTYTLLVGQNEVSISGVTISDWTEVESGDMETTQIPPSYIQFKRNESNSANMTKVDDGGNIENLLTKFRRCLMTTDGAGNATICYLDDSNSTLYSDGTTAAALDGTEGDVMVYFPEYWYKYENVDGDYFRYHFSDSEMDGYIRVEASLVGAYKAYNENDMVYSRSGVLPTKSVSQSDFNSYARARGTGYQIIDYDQHCTIAMMLYAKYLDRNTQAILGTGGASTSTYTGLTNSLGNSDGAANWVNGLGIEGVYGGVSEWIEGVEVNSYVWTVTNPTYNITRTVTAGKSSDYITALAMESGDYFDMVPTAASGGSSFTYYADFYICAASTWRVVYRSYSYTSTFGGVSNADASYDSSNTYTYIGSRLAFRGTITEAASVSDYKALINANND
ncbi:MAG: fimbrillin family protein [Rikenellaceae bacterium]